MITEWIISLEALLAALGGLLFQVLHLSALIVCILGVVAFLCLPLMIAYCGYVHRKEAAKKSPPASVTGQPGLPDRTAQSPPVAGDGGETG